MLGFLKSNTAPIAIDFGYHEVKLLQLAPGDLGELIAAAVISIPAEVRSDPTGRAEFISQRLPRLIHDGQFRGRVAVCSIPAWQTFVEHMQVSKSDSDDMSELLKAQLQSVVACDPANVVVRYVEVRPVMQQGQSLTEVICFAIGRDVVMAQVDLLTKCKLEVAGLHAEPVAILRAFDRLYRRDGDENTTTLYVDVGAGCTKVMVAHGTELKFTKTIQVGGRHLDQKVADQMKCDIGAASAHRLAMILQASAPQGQQQQVAGEHSSAASSGRSGVNAATAEACRIRSASSGGNGEETGESSDPNRIANAVATEERRGSQTPAEFLTVESGAPDADGEAGRRSSTSGDSCGSSASQIDVGLEAVREQLTDELQMCVRYHHRLFPERPIDRLILLGGESRDRNLCRAIARRIGVPSFQGDPLTRVNRARDSVMIGLESLSHQPGWAVAFGLCACSVDV